MDPATLPVSASSLSPIEEDKRLAHFPRESAIRFRCEPSGREASYRYGIDRKKFLHYLRVGSWWLLDPAFFEADSPAVLALEKENIIWMAKSSVGEKPLHWSHHPYTASMLFTLTCLDLKGKIVVDFGCGNGLLGILALKLGASKAIGIDNDEKMRADFVENARLNGVSDKVEFLPYDLSKPESWIGHFNEKSVSVVLGNIGPHYGETDMHAIALLEKFPHTATFVGGGYVHPGLSTTHSLSPTRAIAALKNQGFLVTLEASEMVLGSDGAEKRNRLSFVAKRENTQEIA